MRKPDIIEAVAPIIEAFNQLGILYHIGGSVASSFAVKNFDRRIYTNKSKIESPH